MDITTYIFKFIWRIKYWLIILPVFVTISAIMKTRNMERIYNVSTTIYTGVASGYDLRTRENSNVDWASVSNGIDNLINIITARTTLRNVSLRLYAQNMIYGDSIRDNQYISSWNYKQLFKITPSDVKKLIDKSSVEKTIENLNNYEQANNVNFVYGLFNWFHPHYSYESLKNISVNRLANSDMLEISYEANDPGIAYHTLVLLNQEFIKEYKQLRYGETFNVIEYYRAELARLKEELKFSEDSLISYNIANKIIDFSEQAKLVAGMSRDFEQRYQEILLTLNSSKVLIADLNSRISDQAALLANNREFLSKLKEIAQISAQITRLETFQTDTVSISTNWSKVQEYKNQLAIAESDIKRFTNIIADKSYSKEGIAITEYVNQWLSEVINQEKANAELEVMNQRRKELDNKYVVLSPVGYTIKRREREISLIEQSYLNVLANLNTAMMVQKNLEMTSATLKALNPPLYPIAPKNTARRQIVAVAFIATFAFVLGFFIIIELLDRTLRDKIRTERLIPGINVIGAYPRLDSIRFRKYRRDYDNIATIHMANAIIPYLNPREKPDIINLLSTDENVGKTYLMNNLQEYWTERGLRVRTLSWNNDLDLDSKDFILSQNISDVIDYDNEDIIIVEHKPLTLATVPTGLLQEASLNILVLSADKPWRDIDKLTLERFKFNSSPAEMAIYLTKTSREAAETFLGLLPPFNKLRSLVYRVLQFGLTAK